MDSQMKAQYRMVCQMLSEARQRVREYAGVDQGVADRSQETVDLILQRLSMDGMTEAELVRLAA